MIKNDKKQIAKISIFITSIFVIFISISYAFITKTLEGVRKQVINAGVLELVLEEDNEITISDAYPMYDEVGMIQEEVFNFRLINNTNSDTKYTLNLVDITTGEKLSTNDVRYYLTKNDKKAGLDYLSSISVSGNSLDAQTLKFCKFMYPDSTIETIDDCVAKANEGASDDDKLTAEYLKGNFIAGKVIMAPPANFGKTLCDAEEFTTEEECVAVLSAEVSVSSYEDIGNLLYPEFWGGLPDLTTTMDAATSYCTLAIGASSEADCISKINTQYNQNISTVDEGIAFMLETGLIPDPADLESGIFTLDSGKIKGNKTIEYTFRMWIADKVTENSQISGKSLSFKLEVVVDQIIEEEKCPVLAETEPNQPELTSGMIAVTYNESEKTWVKADTSNNDWYDYKNQIWANAVTVTESTRDTYMAMDAGEPISMDDINTMWVWIPRYSYTIRDTYGAILGENTGSCADLGEITVDSPKECVKVGYPDELIEQTLNFCQSLLGVSTEAECVSTFNSVGIFNHKLTFEDIIEMAVTIGNGIDDTRYVLETYPENDYTLVSTPSNPGAIDIKFIGKGEKDTGTGSCTKCAENWVTPDGFTFGNEEIPGFWMAKFEVSTLETCTAGDYDVDNGCDLDTLTPQIIPNAVSWRGARVSTFFEVSRNMQSSENASTYGFDVAGTSSMDVHMLKNTEWGIVAYLSQSKYGKYNNSSYTMDNRIIYQNKSSSWITGMSNGTPPTDVYNTQVTYDTPDTGYGASSTGTIYGVYDMSGGAWESVMGRFRVSDKDGFCASGQTTDCREYPDSKYYDSYSSTTEYKYGDATIETLNWYYMFLIDKDFPWILRSNTFHSTGHIFDCTTNSTGGGSNSNVATRYVVKP